MNSDNQISYRTNQPYYSNNEAFKELHESRFTLKEWAILDAVARCGSYSDAARSLQISQPSISYAMAKLEGEVGIQLFRLEGRKSQMTQAGTALLEQARIFLKEAYELKKLAEDLRITWQPPLSLVVEKTFPSSILFSVLRQYAEDGSHPPVHLIESPVEDLHQTLASNDADIAISRKIASGFHNTPLVSIRHVAVASPRHPLLQMKRDLNVKELENEVQVVSRSDRLFYDKGMAPKKNRCWELDDYQTVEKALREGFGYGWLPEHQIQESLKSGTLKVLPLIDGGIYMTEFHILYRRTIPTVSVATLITQLKAKAKSFAQQNTCPTRDNAFINTI